MPHDNRKMGKVPMFNGDNFQVSKLKMQVLLKRKRLWEVVCGRGKDGGKSSKDVARTRFRFSASSSGSSSEDDRKSSSSSSEESEDDADSDEDSDSEEKSDDVQETLEVLF